MEEIKTLQPVVQEKLPPLVKQSATYKLIVPEKVEEKIRYLIRKFPHTEWSGVLFYKHTGTFENNDLVLTCEDIYPMDLGTSVHTQFTMTPEVSHYIAEHLELFDCEISILHSHHSLGAFLSGEDWDTLRSQATDTNIFVSLVVDTKGEYVAALTRKVKIKKEITTKDLGSSYEFFGEGEVHLSKENNEITKEVDTEEIQCFMLDVERHEVKNPLASLDERFDEIEKKKEDAVKTSWHTPWNNNQTVETKFNYPKELPTLDNRKAHEPYLFDKKTMDDITVEEWQPDPDAIHAAVCKIIACSLILNVERFDLKQWITKYMNKRYQTMFPDAQMLDEWVEFAVGFFVYHFEDETALDTVIDDGETYYSAIANAMMEELAPYNNEKYPYIREYINELLTIIA